MRLGEVLGLEWGDIDWNSKFIRVERSFRKGVVDKPKNGKSRRVDMSDQLVSVLKELSTKRKMEGLKKGKAIDIIFYRNGEHISQNSTRNIFKRILKKAGLTMDDIDLIELNEAFAVQALYCMDRLGMKWDDPRVNKWGGAIAYGHPLASSGPRLVAFLAGLFKENPEARYGLTTMCVGRGQGYSVIWENLQS